MASGSRSLGLGGVSALLCGCGATATSSAGLLGVGGDLVFDTSGGLGDSFDVAGEFVDGEDEAEGVRVVVELIGFFEGFNGGFDLAELLLRFCEGDIAGGETVFEFDSLLEGHGGLLVGASFKVNQTDVVEGGGVVVEGLGDFETFDGFVEFLFLRVEDAETVIGGGVLLVEFQDGEKSLLGAEGFMIAHGSLGCAPEFFHLHIIAGGFRGFGGFAAENRIQKDDVKREDSDERNT